MKIYYFICQGERYRYGGHLVKEHHGPFSQQPFLTGHSRVNTGVIDEINYGRNLFSVAAIPVSQHAQKQEPGQPKWNWATINISFIPVFTLPLHGCVKKDL